MTVSAGMLALGAVVAMLAIGVTKTEKGFHKAARATGCAIVRVVGHKCAPATPPAEAQK
jgi:hypothetical protein